MSRLVLDDWLESPPMASDDTGQVSCDLGKPGGLPIVQMSVPELPAKKSGYIYVAYFKHPKSGERKCFSSLSWPTMEVSNKPFEDVRLATGYHHGTSSFRSALWPVPVPMPQELRINEKNWEIFNEKRIELIDKDIDGTISEAEKAVLAFLERATSEYLRSNPLLTYRE